MSALWATAAWAAPLCLAWLWRPRRAPDPSAAVLLVVFSVLGAWALWVGLYAHPIEPPGFLLWKPTLFYWAIATVTLLAPRLGWGYPVKIIGGTYFALSNREWHWINIGFAVVYGGIGLLNLVMASEASHREWERFKMGCMMNAFIIVVLRLNFVWLPIVADVCIHAYRRASAAYRQVARLF